MTSRQWNLMTRMVNENTSRSEVEKHFKEEEMEIYDRSRAKLLELRKDYPGFCYWPVETDW